MNQQQSWKRHFTIPRFGWQAKCVVLIQKNYMIADGELQIEDSDRNITMG
jgi:hypothetical protein